MGRVNERDAKNKKTTQRMDSKSNLMGKFTQSVRRIAQDFQDPGTPGGQTKEEAMKTNLRLRAARWKLEPSYEKAKGALVILHTDYENSKARNPFARYALLKSMIKQVIQLETRSSRTLVDVPRQEKGEPFDKYVLRTCTELEKSQLKTSEKLSAENEEKLRDAREMLEDMTSIQIEEDNSEHIKSLDKLIKRYAVLRELIKYLTLEYSAAKYYPFIPRYMILKQMVRHVKRNRDFMDVCHEPPKTS